MRIQQSLSYILKSWYQNVEPNPNRIHKPVSTVIIFQTWTGTEPEKIKYAEHVKIKFDEPEPELYFKQFRFDAFTLARWVSILYLKLLPFVW